jgi:hypothetical protein
VQPRDSRPPRSACRVRGRCGIASSGPGFWRRECASLRPGARALLDPLVPRCEPLIDHERTTDRAPIGACCSLGGTVASATLRSPRTVNRSHPEGGSPDLQRGRATNRRDRRLMTGHPDCPTDDASEAGAIDTCPTSRAVTSEPGSVSGLGNRHNKRQHTCRGDAEAEYAGDETRDLIEHSGRD